MECNSLNNLVVYKNLVCVCLCVFKRTKYFSLQPVFHILRGQSLPNITKTNYLNPCSYWEPIHTNWRRELKKKKGREEKRKQKPRWTLSERGGEKEDGKDRERETRKEQDTYRERDEEEALLGCSGVWDRSIHTELNTVSHCASVLSPRQPTLWPQTQS